MTISNYLSYYLYLLCPVQCFSQPFKDETQTAVFKDPVRTAL